jgi:hypothetical protein
LEKLEGGNNLNRELECEKSQKIIDSGFAGRKLFEIGDLPTGKHPAFVGEYVGGLMSTGNGIMTIGICVKINERLPYRERSEMGVSYGENGDFRLVSSRVESVRDADGKDLEILNALFKNRLQSLARVVGAIKFVVADVIILYELEKQNRRQYLRTAANWTVYFKILNPTAELTSAQKKWVEEKLFETTHGYLKSTTVDVSAGGYRSTVKVRLPEGIDIDCVIEIMGGDNTKAVGRVRGKVMGCSPNQTRSDHYDMRVKFVDMNDSTVSMVSEKINQISGK